jgi:hypothetical protein
MLGVSGPRLAGRSYRTYAATYMVQVMSLNPLQSA